MKSLREFVAHVKKSNEENPMPYDPKTDRDILSQYCFEIEEAVQDGEELTEENQAIWDARPKMWADIRLKGTPDFSAKGAAVWGDCK